MIRHAGQAARHGHQQAGHRVVAPALLIGQGIDVQTRLQFAHRHQAVEQPLAVLQTGGPGVFLQAGLQLANDGLKQIARRHQALNDAVLVDHQHHAPRLGAQLLQYLHAAERLRQKGHRRELTLDRAGMVGAKFQQPRHADHAQDIIQ